MLTRENDDEVHAALGTVFTYGDAKSVGVTDRRLYAWRDLGEDFRAP